MESDRYNVDRANKEKQARTLSISQSHTTISTDSWLAAATTIIFWASAFPGIRIGLESYAPTSLALLRFLIASAVIGIYAIRVRLPLPPLTDIPRLTALGFLGFTVYHIGLSWGETEVPAGTASFIISSETIYMVILASLFLNEATNRTIWAGIFTSFIGVALISFSNGGSFSLNPMALLVLMAAISKAIFSIWQKPLLQQYGALPVVAYTMWLGTALMLPFTPQLVADIQTASIDSTVAIIYMGIFPGAIAYFGWGYMLSRLPASIVGSLIYLIPVLATFLAWVWLGEVPSFTAFIGGVLVLAGVLVVHRGR